MPTQFPPFEAFLAGDTGLAGGGGPARDASRDGGLPAGVGGPELRRFRAALEAIPDGIFILDGERMLLLDCNQAACRLFGHPRQALLKIPPERLFAEPRARLEAAWRSLIDGGWTGDDFVTNCLRADGTPLLLEIRRRAVRIVGRWLIVKIVRDISVSGNGGQSLRRQAAQHSLLAGLGQFALENPPLQELRERAIEVVRQGLGAPLCRLLESGPDDALLHTAGSGWTEGLLGTRRFDATLETEDRFVLGTREFLVIPDYTAETRFRPSPIQEAHGVRSAVEALICGSGSTYGMLGAYAGQPHCFDAGSAAFLQSVANTLAAAIERKAGEERLAFLARFDALTGLPNRTMYLERLAETMLECEREGASCAVLFIDLDRFKTVNDTLGHAAGDALLVHIAERLSHCVRANDTVSRLSGDEFAIVLSRINHPEDAAETARRVLKELARPVQIDSHSVYVSGSVGISLFPRDGREPDVLLQAADQAMYSVKKTGRNALQFVNPDGGDNSLLELHLESQLHGALERAEYEVHYQPRIDLASGAVSGLEALLRWNSSDRGPVSPSEFIPILEDTGLIVRVGEWALETVCRQVHKWRSAGIEVPPVAVNLSAVQFRQPGLPATIQRIVTRSGVDPGLIDFELTESALMSDRNACADKLRQIKAAGHRISVDDFGIGYSSLSYLRRFPLDSLKIDRSFIHDMDQDDDGGVIVLAIINLAHSLGLRVVAEGVESETQLAFVRRHGCDEVQGYLFGQPMPAPALDRFLRERQAGADDDEPTGATTALRCLIGSPAGAAVAG